MSGREASKLYVKLPEFCRLTGLSPSTVHRRVRDGSIACYQPGGPGHLLLFEVTALTHTSNTCRAKSTVTDSATTEGDVLHDLETGTSVTTPKHTDQRGPRPKWKRDLAALEFCTPQSTNK